VTAARAKPCAPEIVESESSLTESFDEETAVREAQRCLGSIRCESCDLCRVLCPDLCITRDEAAGKILIDLDYCKGCGICALVCPKGAIKMVLEDAPSLVTSTA